ncbi:MAG: PaaI family thioesterase [Alphaproteobacteria bacterium]|nr:PaaI family thioesterase [Alphaproteobacteria bacterium]MBL6937172.1 PaaI family thioesterase [Alphaproteobacteria bacterium]MBL7096266.1 PaaI family thioesterase [Alphaproteobacteria bacterium]
MELLAKAAREGQPVDVAALMAVVPYCAFLGVKASLRGEEVVLEMPFDPKLVGNPIIPALHGGVIGSLLETAAIVQAIWSTRAVKIPKPVDFTVDYLRTGRAVTTYAKARLARQGRRVVNVHAELWQEDEARPIATLRGHFLLAGQ